MASAASVRLFGPLTVEAEGVRIEFKTRPIELLFARLCLEPNQQLSRATVIEDVWPGIAMPSSANRLRTTLVLLKNTLQPWEPISSGRNTVAFDTELAQIDLVEATHLLRKVRLLWDREEERECQHKLLQLIRSDLLKDWDHDWITEARMHWRGHRLNTLMRLAQLALDQGDQDEALKFAEEALQTDPVNPGAWSSYLRIMAKQGAGPLAIERFRQVRAELKQAGEDFSGELVALAKHIHAGGIKPELLNRELLTVEQEMATGTIERAFISDPKLLLALVSSPAFRAEVFRRPKEAFRLASDVVDCTTGNDPDRIRAMWAVLAAGMHLNHHETTMSVCNWLIENTDESSQDHRFAAMQLGFVHFELRNWEEAHRWTDRLLELTEKFGAAYDRAVCGVQVASLDWHEGHYERAEAGYLKTIEAFQAGDTLRDSHNLAAVYMNLGFVKCMQFDFKACESWVTKSWRTAVAHGLETIRLYNLPLLGLCKVLLGDAPEGRRMMVEGITMTYRNRSIRFHEIGMDFTAGVLASDGHGAEALALLSRYGEFREKRSHGRSMAEASFADWVRKQAGGAKPNKSWLQEPDMKGLIELTCALLESS